MLLLARRRRPQRGFTLIELMIVVAVVGILAAIAYPSYLQYIRKSRRSDAVQALAAVQQAQERWRANNPSYTSTLSDLGITSTTTAGGYYTIGIPYANASGYVVTATAISGKSQAGDTGCTPLKVVVNMKEDGTANLGVTSNLPDGCWSK